MPQRQPGAPRLRDLVLDPEVYDWVAAHLLERSIPRDLAKRVAPYSLLLMLQPGPGAGHWRNVLVLGGSPAESCELASYYVLADRLRLSKARDKAEAELTAHIRAQRCTAWPVFQWADVLDAWLYACLWEMWPADEQDYEIHAVRFLSESWRGLAETYRGCLADGLDKAAGRAAVDKRMKALEKVLAAHNDNQGDAAVADLRQRGLLAPALIAILGGRSRRGNLTSKGAVVAQPPVAPRRGRQTAAQRPCRASAVRPASAVRL